MGDRYVSSTGSNTSPFDTWAKAATTISSAVSSDSAGDNIYIASTHTESTAGAVTHSFAGTLASPSRVLSVDATGSPQPPTAVAAGAAATFTGANNLTVTGHFYMYGVTYTVGDGTNAAQIIVASTGSNNQSYESCNFINGGNSVSGKILLGPTSGNPSKTHWRECGVKFANAGQGIQVLSCYLVWEGGAILSGGTSPTTLFLASANRNNIAQVSGVDLSNGASTMNLVDGTTGGTYIFRGCKLPASWSGVLVSGTLVAGGRFELHNCDSADTNYRVWIEDAFGSVKQDTSVYYDAGTYDGTTRLSYKHTTTASCNALSGRFYGPELIAWNETPGSVTATVEIVHDGASALTDGEIWLEVMYLGTSGVPLGTWTSDAKATALTAASAQTTSAASWTGDSGTGPNGSTTWNTLKLACTFTTAEKGAVVARVVMGVASKTAYVDPNVTLS